MRILLFPLLLASIAVAQPLKQTTAGRIWLRVPAGQPPLRDLAVSSGNATPAGWEKDLETRARLTDVLFTVTWWGWREIRLSFTSPVDGQVELVLHGPWAEAEPGVTYRQEVLWDRISATGAAVGNGGFEERGDRGPQNWSVWYGDYPADDAWPLAKAAPLEGNHVGASWQDRPLGQTLAVKADQEVTVTLHAKAATLPDFTPPKRLPGDTPAHRALAKVRRGVNLGNCWEAPPPYSWGIRYTVDDIDRIAAEGFDHIRVPVAWHFNMQRKGEGWEIVPELVQDLEPVLRRALDKKMRVFLDWHHFDDLTTDPAGNRARFAACWAEIARHFKDWPAGLFFELLNEPKDALTTEVANPIYADAIAAIRKVSPERIIVVSPGSWGDIRELDKLRLPDGDDRIVTTVHCYEPFYFTHQGAPWVGLKALRGIVYPGPPATPLALPASLGGHTELATFLADYNSLPAVRNPVSAKGIRELLDLGSAWSRHFGRPLHLGEFGSHDTGDEASRDRYARDVRTLAEARGIPWTLWDWKATFGYWNPETNQPKFHSALFD